MAKNLDDLTTEQLSLLLNGLPLLSQAFWGPSEQWCREMIRAVETKELENLGELACLGDATHTMVSYIEKFSDSSHFYKILEADYVRLFVSARGGITASLHQSSYESEDGRLMGRPAKMMAERLKASGLALPGEGAVPADHLAVEIEYLTLLLEGAYREGDEGLLKAAQGFAATELKPWLIQLAERLETEKEHPFYPAAAGLLLALVSLVGG